LDVGVGFCVFSFCVGVVVLVVFCVGGGGGGGDGERA